MTTRTTLRSMALFLTAAIAVSGVALAGESKHAGRFGADAPLVYKATNTGTIATIDGDRVTLTNEAGKAIELVVGDKVKIKNADGDRVEASTLATGQRLEVVHRGEKVLKITVLS
jgi:hypothetical protein